MPPFFMSRENSMFICKQAFTAIHLGLGRLTTCCPSWLGTNSHVDTNHQYDPWDLWNHPKIVGVREGVLNSTYTACQHCPIFINKQDKWAFAEDHLIPHCKPIMERGPDIINIAHDHSCNLYCPSCRTRKNVMDKTKQERALNVYLPFLTEFLPTATLLRLSNNGDPFASKTTMDWLASLDYRDYPKLRIELFTNGLLMPDKWHRLEGLHSSIKGVQQSIDAATPDTYHKLRRGGRWDKLIRSMGFIGGLRANGDLDKYMTYFCVQKDNFREIPNFVDLCLQYNVDKIIFTAIQQWGMPLDVYEAKSLANPSHPDTKEFMQVLNDPRLHHPSVKLDRISLEFREDTHKRYSCDT